MKLKSLFYFFTILFLASCGSKKKAVQKKPIKRQIEEPRPAKKSKINQFDHTKKLAKKNPNLNKYTLAYIDKYAPIAVYEMHLYKIPASITLAQGILESGKGRSELARKSNNHFGIKCHTGWTGERVYHDDDEKGECFRKYNYPETSYKDHSLFLTQRRRYAFLFSYKANDYKKWAYGLKKAGYATDKKYPVKLINIIEDYHLYEFDKVKKSEFTYEPPFRESIKKMEKSITKANKRIKYYKVKKGDTLYSISKRYNTTVDKLKKINRLKSNTISIGQEIKIK